MGPHPQRGDFEGRRHVWHDAGAWGGVEVTDWASGPDDGAAVEGTGGGEGGCAQSARTGEYVST